MNTKIQSKTLLAAIAFRVGGAGPLAPSFSVRGLRQPSAPGAEILAWARRVREAVRASENCLVAGAAIRWKSHLLLWRQGVALLGEARRCAATPSGPLASRTGFSPARGFEHAPSGLVPGKMEARCVRRLLLLVLSVKRILEAEQFGGLAKRVAAGDLVAIRLVLTRIDDIHNLAQDDIMNAKQLLSELDAESDAVLLGKAQLGDLAAFEALVTRSKGRAFAIVRRYLGNDPYGEDILQDAFVATFRRIEKVKDFAHYLNRAIVNRCIDYLHWREKHPGEPPPKFDAAGKPDERQSDILDDRADPVGDVIEREEDIWLSESVDAVLQSLPHNYAMALYLFYVLGLSQQDAAARFGISVEAFNCFMQRARRSAREAVIQCACSRLDLMVRFALFQHLFLRRSPYLIAGALGRVVGGAQAENVRVLLTTGARRLFESLALMNLGLRTDILEAFLLREDEKDAIIRRIASRGPTLEQAKVDVSKELAPLEECLRQAAMEFDKQRTAGGTT